MENYTIDNAISDMRMFAQETNMFVGDPHAAKIADWLQELADFKDETPITPEWLTEKFGEPNNCTWLYSPDGDTDEIEVKEISVSIYLVTVNDLEFGLYSDQMCLCTRGQLRQFLSIGGTVEFVKTHLND